MDVLRGRRLSRMTPVQEVLMLRHCRDPMFRYRRHEGDTIVLAVRWYISYRLPDADATGTGHTDIGQR
jgi:hypothetical protein